MKKATTFFLFALPITLLAQLTITNTDYYRTFGQMLLANEINESGEPFAEALGYDLDELDPMVPDSPDSIAYTLGIENYEYSRYQLGTVVSQSGIGLHMMWSPINMLNASMETDPNFDGSFTGGTPNGFNEDDELMKTIMGFAARTNHTPPKNAWPQFAEFSGGDPHLPQAVAMDFPSDFKTLHWDRSKMEKTFNPGAMGQTLMKQYLWAQDMLGAFHDGNEDEVDPNDATPDVVGGFEFDPNNNVFYGGDNLDGFVGMVLTAEAINKMVFFRTQLAYDGTSLGGLDPATYDPANGIKYFPHLIAVTEMQPDPMLPPRMETLTVTDASSQLYDQISLLWGTLNYKNMMDPDNNSDEAHLAYHSVFDGDPFPAAASQTGMPGPFDLMKGMSKVLFLNMMSMHFNASEGTFVDESNLVGGNVQMGDQISAAEAGYTLAILTKFVEEFSGTPLEGMAMDAINAQANFILNKFKDADGYFNAYSIGTGADNTAKTAVAQAAIARGLYAAYNLTGNQAYLDGADAAYNALLLSFYVPQLTAFRTEMGNDLATYTPFNIAVITGAMREAALVGNHSEAPQIFTRFFKNVGNQMQLSEAAPTGEMGGDSDGDGIPFIPEQADHLPPIFATEATLDLQLSAVDNVLAQSLKLNTYPNPFGQQTNISFELEKQSEVNLQMFDLNGRLIETVLNKPLSAGQHQVQWLANDHPDGVYYFKLSVNGHYVTDQVVLVR